MRDMIAHKLALRQMNNRDIQQQFDGLVDYLTKKKVIRHQELKKQSTS